LRIVSLCPSNTEILFALGAGDEVVAVEKWTDFPPEAATLPKVGTEMDVDMDLVASHKPDLVLASLSVPGMEKTVNALKERGFNHLVLNPRSLEGIYEDIGTVGRAVGREKEAEEQVRRMKEEIEELRAINAGRERRPGVYIEWWPKPAITPGGRCWTRDMVEAAGGRSLFEDRDMRSGPVDYNEVLERDPELIILCWCGIDRAKIDTGHALIRDGWDRIRAVRNKAIHIVEEGEYGRPSPRVIHGIREMAHWISEIPA
jgi:iron complex transport system substrate-binding protein